MVYLGEICKRKNLFVFTPQSYCRFHRSWNKLTSTPFKVCIRNCQVWLDVFSSTQVCSHTMLNLLKQIKHAAGCCQQKSVKTGRKKLFSPTLTRWKRLVQRSSFIFYSTLSTRLWPYVQSCYSWLPKNLCRRHCTLPTRATNATKLMRRRRTLGQEKKTRTSYVIRWWNAETDEVQATVGFI